MQSGNLSSEEYAALITAANKLDYDADDFECAMGFGWVGNDPTDRWTAVRIAMEREAEKILAERRRMNRQSNNASDDADES